VLCAAGCDGAAPALDAVVDRVEPRAGACRFSSDGVVWYVPRGRRFAPIVARYARCQAGALAGLDGAPPIPDWARPHGPTHAVLVAASLQDDLSLAGTREMALLARNSGIPMSWFLGNLRQLALNGTFYDRQHRDYGDDLQIEPYDDLLAATRARLPWFRLVATIDGGGHERDIAHDRALGAHAFWGIAWNSAGTDGIADRGTPWGAYCADPTSYKRPAPDGTCSLVGLEWTARDLTRAFFSGHEEAYSTDPDDLLERAGFDRNGAAAYVRRLVDAYAAAGETTPLVLLAQQEAAGAGLDPLGTYAVLQALYDQARADGMRALTASDAVALRRRLGERPRAVAFPFLPGGPPVLAGSFRAVVEPATLDYVDRWAALTFVAPSLLPVRIFDYAASPHSRWSAPLAALAQPEMPALERFVRARGALVLHFFSPVTTRYALAFWTDPRTMRWPPAEAVAAGRAASVVAFDLAAGENDVVVRCGRCGDPVLNLAP
jgi:hypothetical protein